MKALVHAGLACSVFVLAVTVYGCLAFGLGVAAAADGLRR